MQPGWILLLPYTLLGVGMQDPGFSQSGIDLLARYQDLNLHGAARPDFRTVENGIVPLDFSYFEKLPPETRPFFLEGSNDYAPAYFASQRIPNFDLGGKAYGQLGGKTKIGILDTGTLWNENILVGSVVHQVDPRGEFIAGFKSDTQPGIMNEAYNLGGDYKFGPVRLDASSRSTRDNHVGGGDSYHAGITYEQNGAFARLSGTQTSADFLDRLSYYTETDIKGLDAAAGYTKPITHGPLSAAGVSVFTSLYNFLNNDPYRRYYGGGASLAMRDGAELRANVTAGKFLDNDDRVFEVIAKAPGHDPAKTFGVDFTTGQLASQHYDNVFFFAAVKPIPKLTVTGSFQAVKHFDNETQTIVHFDYALSDKQTLSGRMWQFQNNWAFYARYRRAFGNHGEFQLIFGEPTASRFQRTIMVKLVLPLEIKK